MTGIEILERVKVLLECGEISGDETLFTTYYHTVDLGDVIYAIERVIIDKLEPDDWGY